MTTRTHKGMGQRLLPRQSAHKAGGGGRQMFAEEGATLRACAGPVPSGTEQKCKANVNEKRSSVTCRGRISLQSMQTQGVRSSSTAPKPCELHLESCIIRHWRSLPPVDDPVHPRLLREKTGNRQYNRQVERPVGTKIGTCPLMAQVPRKIPTTLPLSRPPEPPREVLHRVCKGLWQAPRNKNYPHEGAWDILGGCRRQAVHRSLHGCA